MVYRFKLVSNEKTNFSRTIEIDSEATFLQLRNAILDSVGYTKDEMDSFFICEDDWTRHQEVTLEDMGSTSDEDIYIMADTPLYDLVEEEGQKLSFVFDYFTERSFFMELQKIITGRDLSQPVCTVKMGEAPAQMVNLHEFENELDKKGAINEIPEELGDEYYAGEQYNEDEIADGFENIDL